MEKWIVYMHILNDKSYIGYTGKGLRKRLEGHIKEAEIGSERHFCRAIRKYGASNISSIVLFETNNSKEAKRKERQYIKEHDTKNNGYNMTDGGDGGNTTEKYSEHQKEKLRILKSNNSCGVQNPNWAGKTREDILDLAYQVLKDNNMNWVRKDYMRRAVILGYPENINCSGMFEKPWKEELLEYIHSKGCSIKEIKYTPTKTHIDNNDGVFVKGSKWYYNDRLKKSKLFNPSNFTNITNEWKRGRKLKWD